MEFQNLNYTFFYSVYQEDLDNVADFIFQIVHMMVDRLRCRYKLPTKMLMKGAQKRTKVFVNIMSTCIYNKRLNSFISEIWKKRIKCS